MARKAVFGLVGVALLAALFAWLRPAPAPAPAGDRATPAAVAGPAAPPVAPVAPGPRRFELVVREGRLESGPAVLRVRRGEEVLLRVTADRADELHLHGYDLALALVPGVPAELRFTAGRAGRFEYELHRAHAELGALEVHPD